VIVVEPDGHEFSSPILVPDGGEHEHDAAVIHPEGGGLVGELVIEPDLVLLLHKVGEVALWEDVDGLVVQCEDRVSVIG